MSSEPARGVTAAGHPLSAAAGTRAYELGGNAVDAAVAAMLVSFVAESLLTGLGAGGLMTIAEPDGKAVCLDFFVEAPGRGADHSARADLFPWRVDFGDATQIFNAGPASAGTYGNPAGIAHASERFGALPLSQLTSHAAALARDGVEVTAEMSYLYSLLTGIITANPECAEIFAPSGNLLKQGQTLLQPELADALDLLGQEGADPFYSGAVADRVADWLAERGGLITREDLASFRVVEREPLSTMYRGREILTPPPPSAGGVLVALTLSRLGEDLSAPSPTALIAAMEEAQNARTTEFLEGLNDDGFANRFLGSHLGNTTHISTIDSDGLACSVTCSNGSSSGVVVPRTGIHLNNMMGEQDLNPHGFHMHPPGRRLPSMMTPTLVLNESRPTMSVGSAGSNRIRSAIVQTLIQMIDAEATVEEAVEASRLHYEDGVIYAEPGIDVQELEETGHGVAAFQEKNLFFGGVQAAVKTTSGLLDGAGDPRRGGAAEVAR